MGERKENDDLVFGDIHSPSCTNNAIKRWVLHAGIMKDITFHIARHSISSFLLETNDLQNLIFQQVTI